MEIHDASSLPAIYNRLPYLKVGRNIKAEVVDIFGSDVVIRIEGKELQAKTQVPLQKGDLVMLKVESLEKETILKLSGKLTKPGTEKNALLIAFERLKGLRLGPAIKNFKASIKGIPAPLVAKIPGFAALQRLLPHLKDLSAESLRQAVESSGLFFETKLKTGRLERDLKSGLLQLKEALQSEDTVARLRENDVDPEAMRQAANNLLDQVELCQVQSRMGNAIHLFFPAIWDDLNEGEMVFRAKGEKTTACTIKLDLDKIGKLLIYVLAQGNSFHVDLISEDESFCNALQSRKSEFMQQFEASGLNLAGLTLKRQRQIDFEQPPYRELDVKA